MNLTEMNRGAQIAWAAGLFEGEGCISHDRQKNGTRRELKVVSTDPDVIATLHVILGAGRIGLRTRPDNPKHKAQYQWVVSRWVDVERVLREILPYLHERRAAKALELLADPAGRQGTVCGAGHPLSGPGAELYGRQCAPCARRRSKEWRDRNVA